MSVVFTRKTIVITAIAIILSIVTLVSVNVYGNSGPVTGLANTLSRPLKAVASMVAREFESIYNNIYRYDQLLRDYEERLKELHDLREWYSEADQLARENEIFRELNGFRERHPGYRLEEAPVETWSSSNWASAFTIGRGSSNSDIRVGNSVTTQYGVLVGIVTDVGPTTSTVVTVLDTTFSAVALIGEGGDSATATGDLNLMRQGRLKLDYIDEDIPVMRGNTIVTAGGGVFPPRLVIGEVEEVFNHPTGIGRYATIRPVITLDTIPIVFVITDFELYD